MRIFVYLLALLTGLSAAQNAEARHDAAASLDVASAVSDAAHLAHTSETERLAAFWQIETPSLPATAQPFDILTPVTIQAAPVFRGDRSRE